ncbi:hypothetical protein [Acetobacter sicerae]|uniref:hypothetical protein n=1 Tax=Acetobacter sicerae TaxID=85325 RepID=UPI00156B9155|nr:hypothetical protein [Acetobacter sicerae]NHN93394.1 hypothetical protein [Acetobacter sicerae]
MNQRSFEGAMQLEHDRRRTAEVARTRVAPIIGMDAALRMDHAHSLYREALKTLGYDTAGVSNEGMSAMFDMASQIAKPTGAPSRPFQPAMDAVPDDDSPLSGKSARLKA